MAFIFSTFWLALVLYVWFKTPAIPSYLNLVGRAEGGLIATYLDSVDGAPFFPFPTFLYDNKPSFLTKVIACPFCTGFFLSLGLSFLTYGYFAPAAAMLVSGLLLYRVFDKLKLV